jgi:hypothetical protein
VRLGRVCRVQWGCFQDLFWDVGDRRAAQHFVLGYMSVRGLCLIGSEVAHPACVRIEEPPEDAVLQDLLHGATAVEEYSQHALPQLYYTSVFLRLCGSCSVVGHGMLLRYRGYDEGRVQVDQCRAQRCELGIPALYFKALHLH